MGFHHNLVCLFAFLWKSCLICQCTHVIIVIIFVVTIAPIIIIAIHNSYYSKYLLPFLSLFSDKNHQEIC